MSDSSPELTIMLIDDEPSVVRALELLLQAIGYQAKAFTDPALALAELRENGAGYIDLIVCDLRMPELNGLDVLAELKKLDAPPPFVLMSAHADNDDVNKALEGGAAAFLAKPFSPDQFHALIEKLKLKYTAHK